MGPISLNWMKIPKKTREKLLNSVFCTDCRNYTRITNYSIEEDYFGLIVQGNCCVCGEDIARIIER